MFKENDTYIDLIWVEGLQGSGGKDAKKNPKQPTKTNKQKTLKHGYLRWFFPLQKKKSDLCISLEESVIQPFVLYSRFRRRLQHLGTCVFYVHMYIFLCLQNEKYSLDSFTLLSLFQVVVFFFSLNKKKSMWHFQSINLTCCGPTSAHSSYLE